jgi:hypothetical protein
MAPHRVRRILSFVSALSILLGMLLPVPALADSEAKRLEGDRIILVYPSARLSDRDAGLLLKEREEALEWVEEALQLRYEGRLTIVARFDWFAAGASAECRDGAGSRCPSIVVTYVVGDPGFFQRYFIRPGAGNESLVHELVHAVTRQQLGFAGTYLAEGIAVALDLSRRSREMKAHLISKGLLQRGELPASKIVVWEISWLEYYPAGSLVLFLLEEYGLDRFKKLYAVAAEEFWKIGLLRPSKQRVQQIEWKLRFEVQKIYGKDFRALREEWRSFLADFAPGEEQRALYLLQAHQELEEVERLRIRLGERAEAGYLGPVPQELINQQEDVWGSLRSMAILEAPSSPKEQYEEFQRRLEIYRSSLEIWRAAAQNFRDAKERIPSGEGYERIIAKLQEARSRYSQVGDRRMADKMARYMEGFRLLQEGERLIPELGCRRGVRLLRRAEQIFQELQEFSMAARIREISDQRSSCDPPPHLYFLLALIAFVLLLIVRKP